MTATARTAFLAKLATLLHTFLEARGLFGVELAVLVVRSVRFSLATLLLVVHLLHLNLGETLRLGHSLLQNHHLLVRSLIQRQLLADQMLNALKELHVVLSHERDGFARAAGARRTAHTMNVVLGVSGYVKVDDHVHVRNVEASAGHVCREQNRACLRLELVQRAQSFGLGKN